MYALRSWQLPRVLFELPLPSLGVCLGALRLPAAGRLERRDERRLLRRRFRRCPQSSSSAEGRRPCQRPSSGISDLTYLRAQVEIAGGSVGGKALMLREPVRRDRIVTILPSGKVRPIFTFTVALLVSTRRSEEN